MRLVPGGLGPKTARRLPTPRAASRAGLALMLLAGLAAPASAQVLVSNIGQTAGGSPSALASLDVAQGFATGSNTDGYTLTSIEVRFSTAPSGLTVKLATGLSSTSAGTDVVTLNNPGTLATGNLTFTAPANTTLAADTTYWVIVEGTGGTVWHTSSHNQDAGAAAGWSVENRGVGRVASSSGGWSPSSTTLLGIRVNGTVVGSGTAPAAPAAPTLSTTDGTSLTVMWTAPADASPAITDYDVQYRRKGDTDWTDHAHTGTAVTTTITGLVRGASYEAQVRATNSAGTGAWSATGSGHTGPARVVSATTSTNGGAIHITMTKSLRQGGPAGAYTVTVANTGQTPSHVQWSDGIQLALSTPVTAGQTVTVSYVKPTSGVTLQDTDLVNVESFTDVSVTNAVPNNPNTPPTVPMSCGGAGTETPGDWFTATSTATTITVTFQDPNPRLVHHSTRLSICRPGSGGTYSVSGIQQWGSAPPPGESRTVSGLTRGTDYWVKFDGSYVGEITQWHYIRTADSDASVALSLNSAGDDNTYHNGDAIEITATFGESVTVTGTPRIPFTIGTTTRHATYARGSGSTQLVFSYTVQTTDTDTDGITVAANALELNGGRITAGGTDAAIDHGAVAASTNHKVDGGGATISSIEFTNLQTQGGQPRSYWTIGENIEVTVTFDRRVTVTGTPRIALSPAFGPNGETRHADYAEASGDTALVFRYAVMDGDDSGSTHVSVAASALELNGGTIRTGTANATLTHSMAGSQREVSVHRPRVNNIRVISTPSVDADLDGTADTYVAGDLLDVSIDADRNWSTGTGGDDANIQARVRIGATDVWLDLQFTQNQAIIFRRTVQAGDADADGVTVKHVDAAGNVIRLRNNAEIHASLGGSANAAILTHAEVDFPDHRVRGTNAAPTAQASGVRTDTNTDYTFQLSDFSFSDADGDPRKEIQITSLPAGSAGELKLSGTAIPSSDLPKTISHSDIANLVFDPVSTFEGDATFNFKVVDSFGAASAAAATMTVGVGANVSLALNSAGDDNTYHNSDAIEITATFGPSVNVTGTPRIPFTIGTTTRHATYARGSGSNQLVFSYTVQTADRDNDGITVAANALQNHGGSTITAGGTAAALDHAAVAASASHTVDGGPASVSSVAFTNQPTGNYVAIGSDIEITVTFDRPVTVTGRPRIQLRPAFGPGNAARFANYADGSGTTALVFRYTLVEGDDSGSTQVDVAANRLQLNSGTIRTGTENANRSHAEANSGKTVSAKRPRITSIVASPGPGVDADLDQAAETYVGGDVINVIVGFDQDIDIDQMGQASHIQAVLRIGSTDYALVYSAASGSAGVQFAGYTVKATDVDTDGIGLERQSATNHVVRLSGNATIKGTAANGANDAVLTFAADPKVTWTPEGRNPVTRINVRGTNAAPTSTNSSVATATDTDYTFRITDFAFSDADGDPLKEVQIVTLPAGTAGTLTRNGTAVTAGQTVVRDDIANLEFDPVSTFEGDATFTFKAVDSFGAASAAAATMTVRVGASVGLSFNSAGTDNAFHTGDVIEITATFGESVTVTGRPRIPFTLGTATRHAVYNRGSPGTQLVFRYTVAASDVDADGIEVAENALELNGGTINLTSNPSVAAARDHAAVPASASHKVNVAKPAAPAAPTVSRTDGTSLTVTWTAPANTRPAITDYDVEYRRKNVPGGDPTDWTDASHTGTAVTATITGLVQGASYEARVRATNSEGTSDWSAATSGHTGPARFASAETIPAGTSLVASFTKTLQRSGRSRNFRVRVGGTARGIPVANTFGTTEGLLVGRIPGAAVQFGQTVDVLYTRPVSGSHQDFLTDNDGERVASFNWQTVTNNVPAPVPVVTKATLQGAVLRITFSQTLGTVPGGLSSQITVKLDGAAQALRAQAPITANANVLTVVLAAAPGPGAVTVSYTKPAIGKLKAANGNDVESFTDHAVIRPATVQSATTTADGRAVRITFTKNVKAQGTRSHFRVVVAGTEREPTHVLAKADSVVLVLSAAHTITAGQTVTVSYTRPTGRVSKIGDSDDLEVESFSGQPVTNIVPAVFQSATTSTTGTKVIVTFTGPLKFTGHTNSAYTVTADGATQHPTIVSTAHEVLELNLGTAITPGQTVTVSYAKPASNKLLGTTDVEVPAFTDQPVTNRVPATITGVAITSDPGPDRIYQRDDVIRVTVTFNAPVTVDTSGGTPGLFLHFRVGGGAPPEQRNKQAAYTAGSGTNMLVFAYTVQAADDSDAQGVRLPANRLQLNNGTIRTGSTDATLTYAAVPHDTNHRVHGPTAQDVTAPAVSTATVNGATLVLTFNEPLDATGTAPAADAFTVNVRAAGRAIATRVNLANTTPVAISGSAVTLTLAEAVIDADQVWVDYRMPAANPIQDFTAGNDAASFTDQSATNNTPGVAPTVSGTPVVAGTRLVVTFNEPLQESANAGAIPPTGAFTVTVAGENRGVSNVAVSGSTVILTLESAAVFGEAVTVSYTQPGSAQPALQDLAPVPNFVASFGPLSVNNNDATAPLFSSAAVDGATLTITFDENLDGTSVPAPPTFGVWVAGAPRGVAGVALADATVTLTLASAVAPGQAVEVRYTYPDANPLRDGALNEVASFGRETVANNTRAAVTGAPAVTSSPASGDTYGLGEHIELTVTFSHVVTVTGVPQLALTVGSIARQAAFQRGSGTTRLVFRYTVAAADTDSDGVSVAENGLTLNGGAIQDAGDGAATLTHAALGAQAGHKVDGTLVRTAVRIAGGAPVAEGGAATFTLTASPAPATALTVNLRVAQSGNYVAAANLGPQTVTVPASGTATYTVPTVNDGTDEPNGSVTVTVATGTGYAVGAPAAASVTVNDNDAPRTPPPPTPTRPAFSSAGVNGTALTITFNRSLDTGSAPAGSAFTVTATPAGGSARSIPGTGTVSIAGATVTVTLAEAVAAGETVRVSYARPSANPLRGAGSGAREVTNFSGRSVANNTPTGPSAPPPEGGTVSGGGATVTLNFADELDASSTPDPDDFTITVAAASAAASPAADDHYRVTAVSILGATLELTVSPPVPAGREATVSYTPGARPLRTAAGAAVPNFSLTVSAPPPPAEPTVTVEGGSALEGSPVTFTARLSQAVDSDVVLGWSTGRDDTPGALTATPDVDYGAVADDRVRIPAGATEATFSVATEADFEEEGDETFTVTVVGIDLPDGVKIAVPSAVGTIEDDFIPVVNGVSVEGGSAKEGSPVTFTVRLSWAVASDVVLRWFTSRDHTPGARQATPDGDYTAVKDGRVTIAAGETEATFSVETVADSVEEGDETFRVIINEASLPFGVGIEVWTAVGTIEDYTPPPPPNEAPAFDPSEYAFELRENVAGSAEPVALGAVSAADPDGDTLSYELVSGDAARFAVGEADGAVSYVGPGEDFEAQPNVYELAVRASDPDGLSAEALVTVTVVNVNELPEAADDEASTDEDVAVTVDVLANDTDIDGDSLRVSLVSPPDDGTAEVAAAGGVLYTPSANWHGTDSFTYQVDDGNGGTASASVEVTVRPVNDLPEAAGDSASTVEDSAVVVDVLSNDTDIDGDSLRVASVSAPENGTAAVAAGGVLYTPAPNWHGTDSFTYVADDGNGGTADASVEVTVAPVNDVPEAADDEAATDEDVAVALDVLANDTDPDGDSLRVASVSAPANGMAEVAAGGVRYTPAANWHGTDSFTYEIDDGNGGTASASVEVIVSPVNDAPEAAGDSASTVEDEAVEVDVLANDTDIDGDGLRVAAVSAPENGSAAITAGGVLYTPAANWHGTDSFTYEVDDGNGGTASASVEVTVRPVNDAPEAVDDEASTNEDEAVTVDVLANDIDPDGDGLSLASVSAPENGTARIAAGVVLYMPAANWHGTDRFTYEVEDGQGGTASAAVAVTVRPANDAPVAVGTIPAQSLEEGGEPARIELGPFFEDADGDALTYGTVSSDSSVVRATVSGSVLTLAPVSYGAVVVAVAAWDAGGLAVQQAVAVRVSDRSARGMVSHTLGGMARSHLASARMTLGRRPMASRSQASRRELHT